MRFHRVLIPVIRLCQCSGLCPISVYDINGSPSIEYKKYRFATLTAIICVVQLLVSVHTFTHSENFMDWSRSAVLTSTDLFIAITLRVHAGVVLIELYAKRSIQLELLKKFDEIESIFIEKLKKNTNDECLRRRFRQFIIIWVVKCVILHSTAVLGAIFTFDLQILYSTFMVIVPPFYVSTLFYVQLMVYLDVIKYNIESINECLAKLKDSLRIYRLRANQQSVRATETIEICRRLMDLRICYCKTWEATMLINRYARWSLLFGINNEFLLFVVNVYWSLYIIIYVPSSLRLMLLLCVLWSAMIMSHFMMLSMICEQILDEVMFNGYGLHTPPSRFDQLFVCL